MSSLSGPPRPGDVVLLTGAAGAQFATDGAVLFQVTDVDLGSALSGWVWLSGCQLDANGNVVWKRRVFVQIAGVTRIHPPQPRPGHVRGYGGRHRAR